MKNNKWMLFALISLTLSACNSIPSLSPMMGQSTKSDQKSSADKHERVGVLLVQDCAQATNCSSFSLLEPGMQNRSVILTGNISASHTGQLIAVQGQQMASQDGLEAIKVVRIHAITRFDYQPFLAQSSAAYVEQKYGCQPAWDQSYAWRIDGRQPMLIAILTHPKQAEKSLYLEFDGVTKNIASADVIPENLDPCKLG